MFRTLHAALSSLMANIYMCKAKEPGITRKYALKRTQKAIKAIAKGIYPHYNHITRKTDVYRN